MLFHKSYIPALWRRTTWRQAVAAFLASIVLSLWTTLYSETAQVAVPTSGTSVPPLEQRVRGLEAYLSNSDPTGTPSEGSIGPGHNAWMMASSALVLFMTLPGLALFYGGLVRSKNVLSILAQCLGITGLVTILWWVAGYSLVFGTSFQSPFLGGAEHFFLKGVTSRPNPSYSYWVPETTYAMFQLMFAIITPALMIGAIAERTKFVAVLLLVGLWMFLVYFPLAHMVWGATGLLNGVWNPRCAVPAIDFAGGTVVHMSSGWSALLLCHLVGKRLGYGNEPMPPHNLVLTMTGTGMLWVGWYGFNAGSAVAADGIAANAFLTTTLATAVASFSWALLEYALRGKASLLGFCSGAVAGLVAITPACGFVEANGAMVIGALAGVVCYFACVKLKKALGYDDALDTFGIHGVGGSLGAFLTGVFATKQANPNLIGDAATKNGLARLVTEGGLWVAQLEAMLLTVLLALVGTLVAAFVVRSTVGLRPAIEEEITGLDTTEHGEEGYVL
ncbi:ammonium transporter [Candidatus Methylacidithermus pantelleriae]|uniref:Ammonium transporter n=1 Tax=Candidatus Methylacidithermus pantelleriae TaxID=2744239 RepID=A0A8J2BJ80_9BACT|nr:ammonium transporter [Candidatus Methylacidithermus pantelleriae]CAF0691519.1 Ammonium/ammonia transporter [Candidatus Methylacidithermus pantelleriae]